MPTSPMTARFRHSQGFQPLSNQQSDDQGSPTGADDVGGIPLSQIRTNASVGARKANQGGVGPEIERMRSEAAMMAAGQADEKRSMYNGSIRHAPIGRRQGKNDEPSPIKRQDSDSETNLNFMGRLYSRLIAASVMTRYVVYVVPVAFLLAIPLVILPVTGNTDAIHLGSHVTDATTDPPTRVHGPPLFHLFIWFEASWAGLWAGKIVAHLIPLAFMFFCGVISSGTRKYATVLRGLEVPLSLLLWALVTWLVFRFLFQNTAITWISTMTNILGALFVSSAVFLGERAIIHLMSISYHQRSFANRIKESKRDIYLLGLMYDASRTLFPMYCSEFAEEDYIINDSIEAMLSRDGKYTSKIGSQPMRIIGNVGRFGDKVTSVFGNLASEITGKQVFNPNSAHSIVVEALEKSRSSEALARRIWMSFVTENNNALYPTDIEEVLGPTHKEDAEECFVAIDADSNGDISLDEMVRKVVQIGKERKAMANSMKDISEALAAFDQVLLFIVLLLVIFIFLAFFQSSFITTISTAGTALLSMSFVFAVTTQEILGSCIFLFVKHPYDVGDRVDITGPEKESLQVEKISLLYTVFVRIDKMQVVQVPNIVLNGLWIENVTRSKAMRETIDVNVSFDTSFEDIELLRQEMENFVRHPDNARDFQPDLGISVGGVGDCDKLTLKISIKHKSNWHNDMVRANRRSKFMCALTAALRKVPIHGPGGGGDAAGGPANPTYSVSVTDEFAKAAREKSEHEKEAKRLATLLHAAADDDCDSRSRRSSHSSNDAEKQAMRGLNSNRRGGDADAYTLNNASRDSSLTRERQDTFADSSSHLRPSASMSHSHSMRQRKGMVSSAAHAGEHSGGIGHSALLSSQSQRGRRQAGQGLPPMELGGDHVPVDLARYASVASTAAHRDHDAVSHRDLTSIDLERGNAPGAGGDAGVGSPLYASNTANTTNTSTNPFAQHPVSATTSGGAVSLQPLQGATSSSSEASRGRSVTGNRGQPGQAGPSPYQHQ